MRSAMLKLIVSVLCLITLAYSQAPTFDWQVAGKMPLPVKGAGAIVRDSLIYIIGGYSDSLYAPTNKIQIYDPKANTWSIFEDTMAIARYGLVADIYHFNTLVIYGGAPDVTYDVAFSNDDYSLEMWDFMTKPYIYEHNATFNRNFSTGKVVNNYLYIFGGMANFLETDSTELPYLTEFHIPTSTVTYKDSTLYVSQQPVHQMSAVVDDDIYIFGGARYGISVNIHKFNTSDHTWELLPARLNEERAAGAAVNLDDNYILILGGYNESNLALASTEIFELRPETIVRQDNIFSELNFERKELMAVYYDSVVYVFGGEDSYGNCVPWIEEGTPTEFTSITAEKNNQYPRQFSLKQNYPNPFNGQTVIQFQVNKAGQLRLAVHDAGGRLIKILSDDYFAEGSYRMHWNGSDQNNRPLASGIYFYTLSGEGNRITKKMLLIR